MPFPLDTDTEAAIAAGRIKDAYLLDFYLDGLTLRAWNWPDDGAYPGTTELDGTTSNQTYESMVGRMSIARGMRQSASLSSEPLIVTLDGSKSDDDADWVGRFVDGTWHQGRMRVRCVMRSMTTGALLAQPHWEWRGLIDHRNLTSQVDQPQTWEVKCQGGLFRVRGRRLRTRSHEDQQRRSAGDMFYVGTAKMVGVPLIWAKAPANIPGIKSNGGSSQQGGRDAARDIDLK